jgi:hypothetical protein
VFLKNMQDFSYEKPQVLLKKPAGSTCVEKTSVKENQSITCIGMLFTCNCNVWI